MARLVQVIGITVILAALSACGTTSETVSDDEKYGDGDGLNLAGLVGVTKNPPDEFAVIANQPLELPKDFTSLPVPQPGARSLRAPDPVANARAALLGGASASVEPAKARTSAETALIQAVGPSDPTIRTVLAAEQSAYDEEQSLYLLDRYIPSLRAARGEDSRTVVDPIEERARLGALAASPVAQAARDGTIAALPSIPAAPAVALPGDPPILVPE